MESITLVARSLGELARAVSHPQQAHCATFLRNGPTFSDFKTARVFYHVSLRSIG